MLATTNGTALLSKPLKPDSLIISLEMQQCRTKTDKWYYAYKIEGDTITVVDVCHAQNMHE